MLDPSVVLVEIKREFPEFSLCRKSENKVHLVIDALLRVLTFGKMSNYLTDFTTTIGYTVWVGDSFLSSEPAIQAITLRHEREHMRQAKRNGRVVFGLCYLLFPLPFLFAWFRYKWEREAYAETLKGLREYRGYLYVSQPEVKERFVRYFTGPSYFWTWCLKGQVERWFDSVVS